MLPIELRQSKTSLKPMLWLFGLVAAGIYTFILSGGWKGLLTPIKLFFLLLASLLAYVVWHTAKKLRKNEPLLTFSAMGLEINETKPVLVPWNQITRWNVTRSDATDYLIVNTDKKRHSINISWLEVNRDEVEALMQQFMQKQ
jgi:hypothetical protein